MLRDVEPGSSRANTMFRFRCWFSVMKIGRGKPFFDKKNYYLRSGLLIPIVFWVKVCPWILLVKCEWKTRFCYTQTKRTGGSDCSDTDATSHSAGIEPACQPRGPHLLQARLNTPPRRMQPASDCPACLHWIRACANNTSFCEPVNILEHKKWPKYN